MTDQPTCPKCHSQHVYPDGNLWVCPECAHEWIPSAEQGGPAGEVAELVVRDAYGTVLQDGDTVTIIKDLKVKGASASVKVGTKVKNIRTTDGNDGHNIECKIDGFGAMNLKSEFVKKV